MPPFFCLCASGVRKKKADQTPEIAVVSQSLKRAFTAPDYSNRSGEKDNVGALQIGFSDRFELVWRKVSKLKPVEGYPFVADTNLVVEEQFRQFSSVDERNRHFSRLLCFLNCSLRETS